MTTSLARGLRRAVAQNPLSEALDLLLAFGEAFIPLKIQEFQEKNNQQWCPKSKEKWCQFPKQALCSLSLPLSGKIRVFENIPELSNFQIDELIKVWDDEIIEFQKLIDIEGSIIYRLVIKNSYGNKNWFNKIATQLKQNEWEFLPLQLDMQLCRKLCLHGGNTDMMKIMDFYYQDIIYLQLSKQHRDDLYLSSVESIFGYAVRKDEQENDLSVYLTVWEQFGKDSHDEIRLQAAKAAFNYALAKHEQENDLSFYLKVWEQFGTDSNDEIRLQAAQAAFNYALEKRKQENDGDISFYKMVWKQFQDDDYDEIRLQAAKAAVNYAIGKARQEKDIGFFQQVWEQFKDDKYSPIQQRALSAKLEHVNWQIALGQVEIAYQDGLVLLNHPLLDKDNNAALHFLLWLAHPTPETQQACDHAVASLNGEATTWTFDEFAERIASFSDENQAYAKRIIQLLEQG